MRVVRVARGALPRAHRLASPRRSPGTAPKRDWRRRRRATTGSPGSGRPRRPRTWRQPGTSPRALDVLAGVAEGPDRDRDELAVRVALGPPLIAIRGYGDPEVERTYERARALSETAGDAPHLFEAIWGLANYYQSRGDLAAARTFGEQLVAMAQHGNDPFLIAWAHLQLGATTFWRGDPAGALPHLEHAIAVHEPAEGRRMRGAPDPGVAARAYAAWALWQLGYPDRSLATSREGFALGRGYGHPFSLALDALLRLRAPSAAPRAGHRALLR